VRKKKHKKKNKKENKDRKVCRCLRSEEIAMAAGDGGEFDHLFKVLLIGDSGVGKSSLLLRFTSDTFDDLSPTIGVDFKLKMISLQGKRLKLTIWDTAGQERFRTLTSSYYRGAQGVILVYDVTRRATFTDLSDVWLKEVERYCNNEDCIKMLIGNKVDLEESERGVSKKEGIAFAREHGCLFLEASAKTSINVQRCFDELVQKILDTPSLTADTSSSSQQMKKKNLLRPGQTPDQNPDVSGGCGC
jgi:Ras-related protein Rab-18